MSKENARGMQDDVISREQVIEALGELATFTQDWSCHTWMYTDDVYNAIKQLPSIQPEIVRCKDCNHYEYGICKKAGLCVNKSPNGFCDWGERKEVTT